jgi:hypothetical protein
MSEMIKKQIQDLNDVLECCGVLEVTQDHFEFLRLRDRLSNEPVPEEFRAEIEALDERASIVFQLWEEADWSLTDAAWRPRRTSTPSVTP